MACSGAWDWAPYTATYNDQKAHTMSKGIWKSVYLVGVPDGEAALQHLQPRIYYNGSYPSAPLTDSTAGAWTVVARVHLVAPNPSGGHGTINVTGSWGGTVSKPVGLVQGDNIVELTLPVPAGQVSLWWPNGLGEQTLYNLTVPSPANKCVRNGPQNRGKIEGLCDMNVPRSRYTPKSCRGRTRATFARSRAASAFGPWPSSLPMTPTLPSWRERMALVCIGKFLHFR